MPAEVVLSLPLPPAVVALPEDTPPSSCSSFFFAHVCPNIPIAIQVAVPLWAIITGFIHLSDQGPDEADTELQYSIFLVQWGVLHLFTFPWIGWSMSLMPNSSEPGPNHVVHGDYSCSARSKFAMGAVFVGEFIVTLVFFGLLWSDHKDLLAPLLYSLVTIVPIVIWSFFACNRWN